MGRSQRANRGPARYREDRLGDRHYPGYGQAAKGEVINPALKPGDWAGYIYNWGATWPSGSTGGQPPSPNDSATFGGLTLTNTGLPGNAGVLTATGSVDQDLSIIVLFSQDSAAGDFADGGLTNVSQGATLDAVAAAVSNLVAGLGNFLSTPTGAVVNYNLQSAGVIEAMRVAIVPQASQGATVPEIYLGQAPDGGEYAWLRPQPACELGLSSDMDISNAIWVPTTWIQDLAGASATDKAWLTSQVQANSTCPTQLNLPPAPPPPLGPGEVDGPNDSDHGVHYWVSRSGGQGSIWYYWTSVDNHPDPDTKRNLVEFLADDLILQAYRDDVQARAEMLGWSA